MDNTGWTALMYASNSDEEDIVKLLLNNSADINHRNNNGNTASVIAQRHGFYNIVEILKGE